MVYGINLSVLLEYKPLSREATPPTSSTTTTSTTTDGDSNGGSSDNKLI